MNMSFAAPAGPLALISGCHARTAEQCDALHGLVQHLARFGCDVQAQGLSRQILRHFDAAAMQNHAEEEEFLFPTLLESMAGSDAVCLREMTSSLTRQHRVLEDLWQGLRPQLRAVASAASAALSGADVAAFIRSNQGHIDSEASELLPMAARLFTDSELAYLHSALHPHH